MNDKLTFARFACPPAADTAAAFGIDPRVAMLSYSTLGSGSGPQVSATFWVLRYTALMLEPLGDYSSLVLN